MPTDVGHSIAAGTITMPPQTTRQRHSQPESRPNASRKRQPPAAALLSTVALCAAWDYPATTGGDLEVALCQTAQREQLTSTDCSPLPPTGQGEQGIKAPSTAPAGGTIDVSVGPNDAEIEVSSATSDDITTYDIPPSKTITIPIPPNPGAIISISVGRGFSKRILYIEIIAP